ncbi:putative acetyltransferase [Nocardia nova SH22a]|uniref:Putative acetyltransferase n=1 Tax=Nocardia nova SH22a TaxID=1415166 RepID=W5TNH3_9NOCA|nr:GNAT family N-acetyltransferase [Nocardia nova]AHH20518.1 putative acetyltransferase [Nocardia nova SH22a]
MTQSDTRVHIRPVLAAEFDAVAQLTVQTYVGEGHVQPDSPYVDQLADTENRANAAEVLVAVRDSELLGSLTIARPGTPYADIARAGELEFRMLAVAGRARGAGVGTALVRAVLDTARDEGFAAVVLTTMPDMLAARRIYERLGFVHIPERDWFTPRGVPLTVMRRPA